MLRKRLPYKKGEITAIQSQTAIFESTIGTIINGTVSC